MIDQPHGANSDLIVDADPLLFYFPASSYECVAFSCTKKAERHQWKRFLSDRSIPESEDLDPTAAERERRRVGQSARFLVFLQT
jgi:hypothetical protein